LKKVPYSAPRPEGRKELKGPNSASRSAFRG